MSKSDRVVVFGSIVQDLISYTQRFPRPGESVRGESFHAGAGGKGANQAVAAARLGANVTMIGMVGDDMFGESNIKSLEDNGVDASKIGKSKETHTATATITVNSEAENSIVVTLGANNLLTPSVADANSDIIATSALVICQGEVPELGNRRAFEIARKNGVTTFLNPAPGDPNLDTTILELADIICVNENEAEFVTGIAQNSIEDAYTAAKKIREMGPKHVIVTLGSKGVLLASIDSDQISHIKVDKVEAVDTTGAGDCFCGSLVALLVKGKPIHQSVETAAKLAALSVTRKGTQSSYWKLAEIQSKFPNLVNF